jgi:hypothetical protein
MNAQCYIIEQEQREMRKANPVKWFFLMLATWGMFFLIVAVFIFAVYWGATHSGAII